MLVYSMLPALHFCVLCRWKILYACARVVWARSRVHVCCLCCACVICFCIMRTGSCAASVILNFLPLPSTCRVRKVFAARWVVPLETSHYDSNNGT